MIVQEVPHDSAGGAAALAYGGGVGQDAPAPGGAAVTRYAAPPHAVTGAYPAPGRRAAARRRAVFLARSPDLIWLGTRLMLESLPGVVVAGEAPAGAESVAALASLGPPPDLVITAPRAPGLPVEHLLPALRRACPAASLLVLAQLAAGRSGVQAARALGVSERTFKRVVARLHDTLGAP